ncbi:MAG: 2-phosphosulfolactate phosphatase [Actinomycetota bacterium]
MTADGESEFDPWPAVAIHVEWGIPGALLAARRGDLVVVVDVLSFSTSVIEVVARGGTAFCYSPEAIDDAGGRSAVASRHDATLLVRRRNVGPGEFSLSPASLQAVAPDQRLVMTSLNGGRCLDAASDAPWAAVGCLTNRTAVARRVAELLADGAATRCTIVPCGETWAGPFMAAQVGELPGVAHGHVRPSIEDHLGAGAIVAAFGADLRRSVEAQAAAVVFERCRDDLASALADGLSGRELRHRGFDDDVAIAAQLDAHGVVAERSGDRDAARCFSSDRSGRA